MGARNQREYATQKPSDLMASKACCITRTSSLETLLYEVSQSSLNAQKQSIWGLPKIRGSFLGVPIIRTIVFWGLYWGPPFLGNSHLELGQVCTSSYEAFGARGMSRGNSRTAQ